MNGRAEISWVEVPVGLCPTLDGNQRKKGNKIEVGRRRPGSPLTLKMGQGSLETGGKVGIMSTDRAILPGTMDRQMRAETQGLPEDEILKLEDLVARATESTRAEVQSVVPGAIDTSAAQ